MQSFSVVIVDDEKGIGELVRDYLFLCGYKAFYFQDREHFLDYETSHFNTKNNTLYFFDYKLNLPGKEQSMNGVLLAKEVLRYTPNAQFIFMSGKHFLEDKIRESIPQENYVAFLPKPFTLPKLKNLIEQYLS